MPVAEGARGHPGRAEVLGAGRSLGVLARLWAAWPPPGVPWSWSGGCSRRIARAGTRLECRDQGPVHDHGTSRGWLPGCPRGRGTPQSPARQQRSPAWPPL